MGNFNGGGVSTSQLRRTDPSSHLAEQRSKEATEIIIEARDKFKKIRNDIWRFSAKF